ncbi:mitogen-activated protein kinase kinase kinase SSK2 [Saccharomyces eubayanus]|uniref:mitogen-activated protein kinase kinase kinase SSK2 n=1 Tax=Saccharomyces eubayanus TaxID=1080349 RepID=UPI0006C13C78|nr:SSK2-like protein [Saccharomyces eubayanus]KOG97181.1 SSK2-like protein [Saccharomyces eubayanus]
MSHSDYFNYKPYGESTEKSGSSKKRQSSSSSSSRIRSESLGRNTNTTQARVASSPISPGLHSTQYFRSPNAVYSPGESPLNTVQLFNRLPGIQQGQFFHQNAISGSSSSSARSSRRPSNIGLPLPKNPQQSLPKLSTQSIPAHKKFDPSKTETDNFKKPLPMNSSQDPLLTTPTLVISPELASLNTTNTSIMSTPQNLTNQSSSKHIATRSQTNASASTSTLQDLVTTNSSQRSVAHHGGSTSSLRTYKKQYVLNEQLYLRKMRNRANDDYYTRGIVASSNFDDDEENHSNKGEDELELEMNDLLKIEGDDKDNDFNFGYNFITSNTKNNENVVAMSLNYLKGKLDWLRNGSDDKEREIPDDEWNYMLGTEDLLSRLLQNPMVNNRFEWQTMLSKVLKGDIVRNEKTKIANQGKGPGFNTQYSDDIWIELKAWMNGRTVEDQSKSLSIFRNSTDSVFQEIMDFRLDDNMSAEKAGETIKSLVDKYYRVLNLWPNVKRMHNEKPITKTEAFRNRIDTLNSWLNFKFNFDTNIAYLKKWIVGYKDLESTAELNTNNDLNSLDDPAIFAANCKRFAEQIIKEKDIELIFQKKIFFPLAPWILKAKFFFLKYQKMWNELNLSYLEQDLEFLLMFPMCLVKDIILIRLSYARKIQNPTLMMIDQMMDDFSTYIKLAVQMKFTVASYCKDWFLNVKIDPEFDHTVVEALQYFFYILELRILYSGKNSFKTSKEPDLLLKYWEMFRNVGYYIDDAGELIATEFTKLTLRLVHRLHAYLLRQQNTPPKLDDEAGAEKWLIQIFEILGSMKRKLNRFTNILTKAFQNFVRYKIEDHNYLLRQLKETGHFLIYSGGYLEQNGTYLIGSPELLGCKDDDILRIIKNSDIGCDLVPKLEINNSLTIYNALDGKWNSNSSLGSDISSDGTPFYYVKNELTSQPRSYNGNRVNREPDFENSKSTEEELYELETRLNSLGYVLVLTPQEPLLWEGEMYNLSDNKVIKAEDLNLKVISNSIDLMCQGSSYALEYQCDRFQQIASNSVSFLEKKSSSETVKNNLQRINKAYFRCTYSVLKNYPKIMTTFKRVSPVNDLLNNIFLFGRDFGLNFLRINVANNEKRSIIILLMMRLSIGWLKFLAEDCDPTDQRVFRWCVTSMEFAMHMVSGWNVLALDDCQFSSLKQKISECMSLLISHFDIIGARSMEVEKINQQARSNLDLEDVFDDDMMLQVNSEFRVQSIIELEEKIKKNPHQTGKVIDDSDKGNKYLVSLASSISNVSMRWQKRNFVGGGTFGRVFSAVDLDNGEILAVKEINIQDSKAMQKIFPLIKEEMSVLEILNHPNIVSYYGVEVHRDKVNIFMEYCEGGSLAALLEHGRIEDEMVTQVYTLQLLEGLAYLHESGIVHRDVKPENILLDFNGVIKYVDFGAAKKIANNGTRLASMNRTEDADGEHEEDAHASDSKAAKNNENGLQDMMGTPMYMAPESITGSTSKGKFGADDVWSLGCVVLEMITGRRPWSNLDNEWAIMYHVAAGHTPQFPNKDEVSSAGRKFLERCLIQNPSKRASAVELLMDSWIVQIREIAFGDDSSSTDTEERE